jgi:ABC-2 type transport system permease protein
MNLQRIAAMIKRHNLITFRNPLRAFDLIYWPILDLVMWGFSSLTAQHVSSQHDMLFSMLAAIVLWEIVIRVCMEISLNLIEEVWANNLINLWASPLTLSEWSCAAMLLGIIKMFFTLILGAGAMALFFKANFFTLGFALIPLIISLILSGWWIGFLTSSLILRFGESFSNLIWALSWLIGAFSTVFCPLNLYPAWAYPLALASPLTYTFEALRTLIFTGELAYHQLAIGLGLNALYLALSYSFFVACFEKGRELGLGRLKY